MKTEKMQPEKSQFTALIDMKRQLQAFECGGCGSDDRLLLHNIRHRGSYRRLCTNCILKAHQGLFCAICLQVFDNSQQPSSHARLTCLKCPSVCHLSCFSSASAAAGAFVCPSCLSPNFTFFEVSGDDERVMDVGSARALAAAAKLAAFSMSKAAAVARVEAERRVKEAALAKKRAREALERLLYLAAADEKGRVLKKVKPTARPQIGAATIVDGSNGLYK